MEDPNPPKVDSRLTALNRIGGALYYLSEMPKSREVAIAITKLQEAEMWLKKGKE